MGGHPQRVTRNWVSSPMLEFLGRKGRLLSVFFVFVFIWSFALFAGVTMVWLLAWAIRRGEFQNPREAAKMIFDEEEPIGRITDHFPGEQS